MIFILSTSAEIQLELGRRLKQHRLAQSLSQAELASMAGLSMGAVCNLERRGQCSLETFIRVVQTLGLAHELDSLFEWRNTSIAQMALAEQATRRQRAPRKTGGKGLA